MTVKASREGLTAMFSCEAWKYMGKNKNGWSLIETSCNDTDNETEEVLDQTLKILSRVDVVGVNPIHKGNLSGLANTQRLTAILIRNNVFDDIDIAELPITANRNLQSLYLDGNVGMKGRIPLSWAAFEKLRYINLNNLGLTSSEVDSLLEDLKLVCDEGMGSDYSGTKKVYLAGTNKVPTNLNLLTQLRAAPYDLTIYVNS